MSSEQGPHPLASLIKILHAHAHIYNLPENRTILDGYISRAGFEEVDSYLQIFTQLWKNKTFKLLEESPFDPSISCVLIAEHGFPIFCFPQEVLFDLPKCIVSVRLLEFVKDPTDKKAGCIVRLIEALRAEPQHPKLQTLFNLCYDTDGALSFSGKRFQLAGWSMFPL